MTTATAKLALSMCVIGIVTAVGAQTAPTQAPAIPEYAVYRHVFHHVVVLKKITDDAAQSGKDRSLLRQLVRRQAGLTDEQGAMLEAVALQCEADVAAQDALAHAIIARFRAQYPFGMVNKSFPLAPPSPELQAMQQERNSIILRARDSLRSTLGEEAFAKLDTFAKQRAARDAQPLPASAQ